MMFLIELVATYAPWIYAVCGLVALYQMSRTWQVRAERRQALFSLERDRASRDLYNIFFIAMSLLVVMGITYFLSTTLATAVEAQIVDDSETNQILPQELATPSPTPLPDTPTPTITPTPLPTRAPVQVVEESMPPTATPQPVVSNAASCPDPRVAVTSPGQGAIVTGVINVMGRAVHENFQYYKIEYSPGADATEGFIYLAGGNSPIDNGSLGVLDSNLLANGVWTLRVIVVDQTGNFPPPCNATITVQN
ncbi:hypothetical protein KFU94_21625 [Chloroflexi bacterium TSY]|nr:hypothetical protein [Chloroflexi bacterium TSY]